MARFLRRCMRLSKLTGAILLFLLISLTVYLTENRSDGDANEDFTMIVSVNESSTDYRFIQTYFSGASEGSWQNVSDVTETEVIKRKTTATRTRVMAFSAFLDNRSEKKVVRLIAVTRTNKRYRKQIWCKFWYQDVKKKSTNYTTLTKGEFKLISEHWSLPYSAYYVLCPVTDEFPVPHAVSLMNDTAQVPENLFKVIVNAEKPTDILDAPATFKNMAVCVKPLHYDYNKVMEILEFIELHQIMGVNHFFLYNHTLGPQVNCLLKNYVKEGIVTILPWQLPLVSQKEIRTEGIFAALNDCLFRTMHLFSHVIFIDFDEYIIPRNNFTYMEFFSYLNSAYKEAQQKSAFIFQNAFFYRQWPDDPEVNKLSDPLAPGLIVLKKTRRKTDLHPHSTRSKYIVRPELINMVGNHFIWEFYNRKFKSMKMSPKDGILHHYRICEFGGDDCVTQPSVVDRTAYKYKDDLLRTVRRRFEKHKTECQLENFTQA